MRPSRLMVVMVASLAVVLSTSAAQTASTVWRTSATSQPRLTTLVSFNYAANGLAPQASLVQGTDGNFYGTTDLGGVGGSGDIFRITAGGVLTELYSFCVQNTCPTGASPKAPLIQATNGRFYATSAGGGANGGGTIFEMNLVGKVAAVYSFCFEGTCTDNGSQPTGALVQAPDGNFYGTAGRGGASTGNGTVFKITPGGALTTLYIFCAQPNCTDGSNPYAGLAQGIDGNFYGTTGFGGAFGVGEVFKITPNGTLTVLHSFGFNDGAYPSSLILANDGNFYGTTGSSGTYGGGTVFKITSGGALTTLYNFCSRANCADGSDASALAQATDGNLYGTTVQGGDSACNPGFGCGTVFKITPVGTLTTLHAFNSSDGANPESALVQGTNGNLYGTTEVGGAYNSGTVFSLSVGLDPFVETQTESGKVGSSIVILGTNLTGATSVTFNGIAAVFTVVSSSEITATVPTGATTGPIVVTIPTGPLTSNKKFRIVN